MSAKSADGTKKMYLVPRSIAHADGTQTFGVMANSPAEAKEMFLAGKGDIIFDEPEVTDLEDWDWESMYSEDPDAFEISRPIDNEKYLRLLQEKIDLLKTEVDEYKMLVDQIQKFFTDKPNSRTSVAQQIYTELREFTAKAIEILNVYFVQLPDCEARSSANDILRTWEAYNANAEGIVVQIKEPSPE